MKVQKLNTAEELIQNIHNGDFEVIMIDSCEYVVFKEKEGNNRAFGYMAYKGNCSNPIHCRSNLISTKY